MKLIVRTLLGVLVLGMTLGLVSTVTRPAEAQLILVNERLYVTEIRADKNKFGVSVGQDGTTRNWVYVDRDTRSSQTVGGRNVQVAPGRILQVLKRGSVIRVHGGRNVDQSIVAKKIWF